jgi:hypothetical protein
VNDTSERLQRHVNLLRGDPILPLKGLEAIEQAYRLRMQGVTYGSLATVMGVYHGEWYTESRWRAECKKLGAPRRTGAYRGSRPKVKP